MSAAVSMSVSLAVGWILFARPGDILSAIIDKIQIIKLSSTFFRIEI